MENKIELKTLVARNVITQELVTHTMDEVLCNGTRIAFVDHKPGSLIRFIRRLTPVTEKQIIDEVAKLRKSQGKEPIADVAVQPPDPAKIAAYMDVVEDDDDE